MKYTLLLQSGRVVDATGESPPEACQAYANGHPGDTVVAWRPYQGPGEIITAIPIEVSPQAQGPGRGGGAKCRIHRETGR